MAQSTVAQYPAAIPSTIADYLSSDSTNTVNKEHDLVHNRVKNELIAMATEMGVNPSGASADIGARMDSIDTLTGMYVNVVEVGMNRTGWTTGVVRGGVTGTGNASATANSNLFVGLDSLDGGGTTWFFPMGEYASNGLAVTKQGSRVVGAGGQQVTIHMDATGNCMAFAGTNAPGFAGRLYAVGLHGVHLNNRSTGTNVGLKILHVTGSTFSDVWQTAFRGVGGGLHAHDFADSSFWNCHWDFMGGGGNETPARTVMWLGSTLDAGEINAVQWACDSLKWFQCRWENCGDRLLHTEFANGLLCNKLIFIGCKFENSQTDGNGVGGSNDANQAQFWLDTSHGVVFSGCEWTYNQKRATVTWILQTIFRLKGSTTLSLDGCYFNFGSVAGTTGQVYTNFFILDAANQLLALTNVWINSGNTGGFPTDVISCTNSPVVTYKCCGFTPEQGAAKAAGDWITGTVATGGVIG